MKIEAILFDFDHTLGDRARYAYAAYSFFVTAAARAKGMDAFTIETIVQDCMVLDQHGNVNKIYVRNEVLFPQVPETLRELRRRGYRLGVITNGAGREQRRKLQKVGLENFWDVLLIGEEVGIWKPDPAIYRLAAEKLGLPCEACAFVGDLWQTDLLGAYRAAMTPIWMTGEGLHPCADGMVRTISNTALLLDIFPAL